MLVFLSHLTDCWRSVILWTESVKRWIGSAIWKHWRSFKHDWCLWGQPRPLPKHSIQSRYGRVVGCKWSSLSSQIRCRFQISPWQNAQTRVRLSPSTAVAGSSKIWSSGNASLRRVLRWPRSIQSSYKIIPKTSRQTKKLFTKETGLSALRSGNRSQIAVWTAAFTLYASGWAILKFVPWSN